MLNQRSGGTYVVAIALSSLPGMDAIFWRVDLHILCAVDGHGVLENQVERKCCLNTIFFDLDGTLTDPKIGITRCIQYALEGLQIEAPSAENLLWCIGPPLQLSFVELVGKEQAPRAVELYRERFATVGWLENQPYDGIGETLERLVESGLTLHVATSKPLKFAQLILDHFELTRHFDRVFGAMLDGALSDKSDLLSHALTRTGFPANASMVGDREHDMIGATSNGIAGVGVTYGYGSLEELIAAGASHTVSRHQDLVSYFVR